MISVNLSNPVPLAAPASSRTADPTSFSAATSASGDAGIESNSLDTAKTVQVAVDPAATGTTVVTGTVQVTVSGAGSVTVDKAAVAADGGTATQVAAKATATAVVAEAAAEAAVKGDVPLMHKLLNVLQALFKDLDRTMRNLGRFNVQSNQLNLLEVNAGKVDTAQFRIRHHMLEIERNGQRHRSDAPPAAFESRPDAPVEPDLSGTHAFDGPRPNPPWLPGLIARHRAGPNQGFNPACSAQPARNPASVRWNTGSSSRNAS